MTPEQEEQVRAALAAAGPDEPTPMPPEVVARLQGVLDELAEPRLAAQAQDRHPAAGTPARRRRRWPDLLVAAAAVAVIAGAGAAVVTRGFGAGSSPTGDSAGSSSRAESTPGAAGGSAATGPSARALAGDGSVVPRLRTASLRADLRRLAADGRLRGPAGTRGPGGCARPVLHVGERLVAVRLDGRLATLVTGPVTDGTREARVYSCGDVTTPVARASVPAR
jgi:hypothetical protein